MPFQKSINTHYGVPAVFWTLDAVQDNYRQQTVNAALAGYASLEAFQNKNDPLEVRVVGLQGLAMRASEADIEVAILQDEAWSDATRVDASGNPVTP